MNQNVIIGIIVAFVVLVGGYFILNQAPATTDVVATTTDTTPAPTDTTPAPTPAVPAAPVVTTDTSVAPTNSTAVVTGKVTPNGAPTSYWYEYGATANLGSKTSAQSIGSGWSSIASPAFITGLQTNKQYYFRLTAQNQFGTVSGATYSFSTNNNPAGQDTPPAATTNAATDQTRVSATLNASINAHSSQTTFWFEYGTNNNFGSVTSFQSAGNTNAAASVATAISGLQPVTKYFFRVNAQNQFGTVNGATQTFTTKGPAVAVSVPVVTTQVASGVTTNKATLIGTVLPSGNQTTYWFEYNTNVDMNGSIKSTSHKSAGAGVVPVSVQADISGLSSGTTYYARIVAVNDGGTVRGSIQSLQTK